MDITHTFQKAEPAISIFFTSGRFVNQSCCLGGKQIEAMARIIFIAEHKGMIIIGRKSIMSGELHLFLAFTLHLTLSTLAASDVGAHRLGKTKRLAVA